MNIYLIFSGLFIAVGFSGWPIVGSYTKASGAWISTLVICSTAAVVVFQSSNQLTNESMPSLRSVMALLVAGTINGLAFCHYSNKTSDQEIQIGLLVVLVSVLMVMTAPILDYLVSGATITLRQGVGLFLACTAVYLISS